MNDPNSLDDDPEETLHVSASIAPPLPRGCVCRYPTRSVDHEDHCVCGGMLNALTTTTTSAADEPTIAPPPFPFPVATSSAESVGRGMAEVPRAIHLIGLHHTAPTEEFNHCAFTGKQMRFPEVARLAGYSVIEYSNAAPQRHGPHATIPIFDLAHLAMTFGDPHAVGENYNDEEHARYWESRVLKQMHKHVKPGDIVAHVMPPRDRRLITEFPEAIHVELGIGYTAGPCGAYRIFESHSWRAWHSGKYLGEQGGSRPEYPELVTGAVVPNYYNVHDWAPSLDRDPDYFLFVGRMTSGKGIEIIEQLARMYPTEKFYVVSGDPRSDRLTAPNIHWAGRVSKRSELALLYSRAKATIIPTRYWEPFGGVCAESLLCGTPVIASDFGVFPEHVQEGDGILCGTLGEFASGVQMVLNHTHGAHSDDRLARQDRARARWSYKAVAPQYRAAFESFRRMHEAGIKPVG
jgi:glycosyltransferase involved in cell wall biosynthesis